MNKITELEIENDKLINTTAELERLLAKARHYVECYHMQFPTSGAGWIVEEIDKAISKETIHSGTSSDTP